MGHGQELKVQGCFVNYSLQHNSCCYTLGDKRASTSQLLKQSTKKQSSYKEKDLE